VFSQAYRILECDHNMIRLETEMEDELRIHLFYYKKQPLISEGTAPRP
jgi:hypothetical protein